MRRVVQIGSRGREGNCPDYVRCCCLPRGIRHRRDDAMFGKAAIHRFAANRLDLHALQRLNQIVHDALLIDTIVGTEATPEAPTHTLQDALPPHIICPTFRAMITVTIALDGKAPPAFTLDHHVNRKTHRSYLWNYAIAARYKRHKHRAFEFGLAEVHEFGSKYPPAKPATLGMGPLKPPRLDPTLPLCGHV